MTAKLAWQAYVFTHILRRAYPNTLRTIKNHNKQTILLYKRDDSLNYILKLSFLLENIDAMGIRLRITALKLLLIDIRDIF